MSLANPIRVFIVDDHDMLREGLTSFIRAFPDLIMIGEAAGGSEAIRLCRDLQPDVVLLDLMMPEIDGITVVEAIHLELPAIRFIALSSFSDDKLVKAAFRAGVTGFLLKNINAARLAEAIRATHAGLPILSPEITQSFSRINELPEIPDGNELTQRELEVLNLMIAGLSNAEISLQMKISIFTVKNHVSSVLVKMGVSSRTEAVSHALQKK